MIILFLGPLFFCSLAVSEYACCTLKVKEKYVLKCCLFFFHLSFNLFSIIADYGLASNKNVSKGSWSGRLRQLTDLRVLELQLLGVGLFRLSFLSLFVSPLVAPANPNLISTACFPLIKNNSQPVINQ